MVAAAASMGEETEAPSLGLSDEVVSIPIWGGFGGGGALSGPKGGVMVQ